MCGAAANKNVKYVMVQEDIINNHDNKDNDYDDASKLSPVSQLRLKGNKFVFPGAVSNLPRKKARVEKITHTKNTKKNSISSISNDKTFDNLCANSLLLVDKELKLEIEEIKDNALQSPKDNDDGQQQLIDDILQNHRK